MVSENQVGSSLRWWAIVGLGIAGYLAAFALWQISDTELPATGPPGRGADLKSYFLPGMAFIRQSLLDGELPLWNPYALAGSPFIALHHPGALYPLLVAFAPLPPHLAIAAHGLLHLALAGIFTAVYARKVGLQAGACLAAGLAYMGSGPLITALFNTAYLSTFVWLPAILWAIEHLCDRPGRLAAVRMAGAIALCFLAGHVQAFVYSVQFAALYGAARLFASQPRQRWLATIGWSFAAGLLAVGLIAIQLLPTASHAASAARSLEGLVYNLARWSQLRWTALPEILAGQGHYPFSLPFLFAPLVVAALLSSQRMVAATLLAIFLLCFDFMTGGHAFGSRFYYALPAGNLFRFPTRMDFAYHFAAATLIGFGANFFILQAKRRSSRFALIASILIPSLLAIDLFSRNRLPYHYDLWSDPFSTSAVDNTVDLAATAGYDRMFIQNHAWVTVPLKFGTLRGVFALPDYDPMPPGLYTEFFEVPGALWHGRLEVVDPWPGKQKNRNLQPASRLDLLSVRYYVDARTNAVRTGPNGMATVAKAHRIRRGPPAAYKRESALPRTYIVKDVIAATSDDEALARVKALDFDPRQTAVVIGTDAFPSTPLSPDDSARITAFRRNDVSIEASCTSDCLLVLTDLYDPDWSVHVDGAPRELLRANYLVRGVRLEAGTHRVDFHYRAPAFWTGAATTLITMTIAIYLAASGRRRPSREP